MQTACKNIDNAEEVVIKLHKCNSYNDKIFVVLHAIMKGKVKCPCGCNPENELKQARQEQEIRKNQQGSSKEG